jgi:hypothetical protein
MSSFDLADISNRPQIILSVRRNPGWRALCEGFGIDPYGETSTITLGLFHDINELRDVGVLEFDGDPRVDPPHHDSIRVTQKWIDLQTTLGLSLHDLARTTRNGRGIAVVPLFGRPRAQGEHPDVFVIMPYKSQFDAVYVALRKVAQDLSLSIRRADERLDSGNIMMGVWDDIFHAKVIVAECSEPNANVFYELGIVHTLGKATVMIRQTGTEAPFDIASLMWIEYAPARMIEFEQRLSAAIKEELPDAGQ